MADSLKSILKKYIMEKESISADYETHFKIIFGQWRCVLLV